MALINHMLLYFSSAPRATRASPRGTPKRPKVLVDIKKKERRAGRKERGNKSVKKERKINWKRMRDPTNDIC